MVMNPQVVKRHATSAAGGSQLQLFPDSGILLFRNSVQFFNFFLLQSSTSPFPPPSPSVSVSLLVAVALPSAPPYPII